MYLMLRRISGQSTGSIGRRVVRTIFGFYQLFYQIFWYIIRSEIGIEGDLETILCFDGEDDAPMAEWYLFTISDANA